MLKNGPTTERRRIVLLRFALLLPEIYFCAMARRKLEKYLTRQFEQHVSRNSVEREQKYRIADVRVVRQRLLRLGAAVHAKGFERNEIFDCNDRLRNEGRKLRLRRHGNHVAMLTLKGPRLAVYPWGIQQEMKTRAESPQSMVLVVPNGRAKLLNALPFAVADLKTETLTAAWPKVGAAWKSKEVQDFVRRAQTETELLKHANECWDLAVSA